MFGLGMSEILLLVILGVLLYGKDLPEVGRALGKGILEFKKGLRGIEDEFQSVLRDDKQYQPPTAPKVENRTEPEPHTDVGPAIEN